MPSIDELVHGAVGESERAITQFIADAKLQSPSLLLLDEFDVIFGSSNDEDKHGSGSGADSPGSSLSAALISALDDLDQWNAHSDAKVFVVAATRRPWRIPSRFLQPQRLGLSLSVGVLSTETKEQWVERVCACDAWASHFSAERVAWLRRETVQCGALVCDLLRMRREAQAFFGAAEEEIREMMLRLLPPAVHPETLMAPHIEWAEKTRLSSVFET